MEDAGWVPVTLDPLVPPARLGALMIERRTERGLGVAELAQRSNGLFTAKFLANAERGRVALDDVVIADLVGLYELHAGPVVPSRHELVLDLDRQQLQVGEQSVSFDSPETEAILTRYVALVYSLRGQDYGTELTLRDKDLDVLARSLGATQADVRAEIHELIGAPESVAKAKAVSRAKMVLGAGLLVGVTAIGTLVLVRGTTSEPAAQPDETLSQQLVAPASTFAATMGAAAEASIDFDFRSQLEGWEFRFDDDHPSLHGLTRSDEQLVIVHVEQDATVDMVASVLMHEVGHAIDLDRMTDEQRAEWIELRGIPAVWWTGNGLSDFAVGSGDFAEAVAAVTVGSKSNSVYGPFTEEQLAFVKEILGQNS